MDANLFSSDTWKPALDKYAEASELTVKLFDRDGRVALHATALTPLIAIFREYGFDPGLYAECARRCLLQTYSRPMVVADDKYNLAVVGTSLVLDDRIVGVAVAGYAISTFSNVAAAQRWSIASRIPFYRLWEVLRRQPPLPERRLMQQGQLLQVLGDALLRENHRTRQLEEALSKLQAADAAKDEFLAVLSHELRTPLSPIAGWAAVMKKSESMEHVRTAAEAIERNALLQSRMVDDLLDTSRIAHRTIDLDIRIHELSKLVCASLETSTQDITEKSIQMEFTGASEPLLVAGDAGRLQQVFRNIISNAVKFTSRGGSVHISCSRDGGDARVLIADTGAGIAPEFLPSAFELFRQQEHGTRRGYQGLGIGLALVKQLVELHDGAVSIDSAGPGHGTGVTVRLPLAAETRDISDAGQAAEYPASNLDGMSILVVEDAEDTRNSLQALLRCMGATVSTAQDGLEALDVVARAKPDVVLCDLRMPRMDGFEFMRELKLRAPDHPPVVAVSALAAGADRQRARDAGFESHIAKPCDMTVMVSALSAILARRRSPGANDGAAPRAERRRIPRQTAGKILESARIRMPGGNSGDGQDADRRSADGAVGNP